MIKSAELENSAYEFEAKMPLRHAVPLGLQHVFAMFVGNLTPLLIITSACGLAGGEFADLQVSLLQNAMFVAGIVTLVQLYGLGPVGGKVPIIMGTSSGFLGVFNSVAATMGGDVTAYGAMMGASILGGLFESVLGVFLKPLRKLFPPVVTGTVVLSIGLSLILSQGIGDTIRVSLTGDPVEEIKSAKLILRTLGLRKGGIEVVSCPTCGRTQINLIDLATKVEKMVEDYPLDIKVAVMGCVVNGPGEAKEADLGVAGGIGEGLLIKHGEIVKKLPEDQLLPALKEELDHWS